MELILALIALIIIFSIAFLIGAKQGANQLINQIKKDGGYYDMEYTSSVYPILGKTSSLNETMGSMDEVPKEFLMGGDIDRALYIAGVKEPTPAKIAEWQDERFKRASVEAQQIKTIDNLLSTLDKADLQLKAGIVSPETTELLNKTKEHAQKINISIKETKEQGISLADLATPKGYDPIEELKRKTAAARKEADRVKVEAIKRNFEALPLSRLSPEGMSKIIELVREDIANQIKDVEQNTPEINEDNGIGKKPKTQTNYQSEFKKANPKQFNGVESDKPFVKTRKIDKIKVVKGKIKDLKK